MHRLSPRLFRDLLLALGLLNGLGSAALAADLGSTPPAPAFEAPVTPEWSYRFTPYGWLTALNGTQTVRGRSVKVNASFVDIVKNSDSLVALMGDFEARRGPFSLYGDVVWSNIGADGSKVKTRTPAPGVTTAVGGSLSLDIQMAIAEAGATYEFARFGGLAFDILAGVRYWYQDVDLSFQVAGLMDAGDLEVVGARAFARSGSVDWLDPLIGARVRYAVAPGHELFLRGDIGGFGVGSEFSWQAVGGYIFDFGVYNGITFSGVVGYRALYVDYAQGEGRHRYEFDMLQHGPVVGISAKF